MSREVVSKLNEMTNLVNNNNNILIKTDKGDKSPNDVTISLVQKANCLDPSAKFTLEYEHK